MINNSTARWVAVMMAAVLAAVIFLAPRSIPAPQYENFSSDEARFELGRAYVESSRTPMVGIKILQKIVEDNPKNIDVRWYLGTQAIRTGQYRKAINHLKAIAPLVTGKEKSNCLTALAFAYEKLQITDSVQLYYQNAFEISQDSLLLQSLKKEN